MAARSGRSPDEAGRAVAHQDEPAARVRHHASDIQGAPHGRENLLHFLNRDRFWNGQYDGGIPVKLHAFLRVLIGGKHGFGAYRNEERASGGFHGMQGSVKIGVLDLKTGGLGGLVLLIEDHGQAVRLDHLLHDGLSVTADVKVPVIF